MMDLFFVFWVLLLTCQSLSCLAFCSSQDIQATMSRFQTDSCFQIAAEVAWYKIVSVVPRNRRPLCQRASRPMLLGITNMSFAKNNFTFTTKIEF